MSTNIDLYKIITKEEFYTNAKDPNDSFDLNGDGNGVSYIRTILSSNYNDLIPKQYCNKCSFEYDNCYCYISKQEKDLLIYSDIKKDFINKYNLESFVYKDNWRDEELELKGMCLYFKQINYYVSNEMRNDPEFWKILKQYNQATDIYSLDHPLLKSIKGFEKEKLYRFFNNNGGFIEGENFIHIYK